MPDALDALRLDPEPVAPRDDFAISLEARMRRTLEPLLFLSEGSTGMTTVEPDVTVSISYADAHAGIRWLEEVLGFVLTRLYEDPEGSIPWAQVRWGSGAVTVHSSHEGNPMEQSGRASISLKVPDRAAAEVVHQRAIAAGANVVNPLEETFYGGYGFSVEDPEGHLWSVGTAWLESDAALNLPQRKL